MSMLAERKSKQRWSLNPRGSTSPWVNDKNNFGHKMLEKMGWSHGKGLGANETGVTEPIKIGYKNDNKGMGYKEKDDQWRDHDLSFNALLETLSNNLDTNGIGGTQPVSLEEKSQTSKARVHYKKFTRGKDLSRYSEKDLANIFGKKSLNSPKTESTDEPIQPVQKATVESSFLHNSGSMVDYFKQKLAKFQSTPQRDESDGDDEEKPARLGFGFASESINDKPENDKKRKLDCESGGEVKKKKKKKKIEEAAIDNPVFDETLNSTDTSNTNFEVVREKKKAKKKKESYENPVFNGNDSNLDTTQESCGTSLEVVRKKAKKTKKIEEATNLAFDANLDSSQEISNTNFEVKRDGKKSKKKQKIADSAVDNPVFNGDDAVSEPQNESNNVKKKSKKKAASVENSPVDTTKKKKTKKKKLSDQGIDNVVFNGDTANSPNTDYDKKFEVSRKIHKNSKIPIDNPCFNDNSDCSGTLNQTPPPSTTSITITSTVQEEISCDLMMNTITTPILKTPSSRQDSKRGKNKNKNVRFSEVNQQHIIPNKEDQQKLNELADINTQIINSNLKKFSKRIDGLEAEIENDMNEAKLEQIHNNTDDNNNKEGDGGVLIKFRRDSVKFAPIPIWLRNVQCKAKSSYKHLITSDFVVNFKNTNFGEIQGYGTNTNNKN